MFQQYNELTYSYEIADDYINLILGNCEKYIHDQQILKNAQKFAIYSALQQIDALAVLIPKEETNQKQTFTEDQEPPCQKEDSWQIRPAKYQFKPSQFDSEIQQIQKTGSEIKTHTFSTQKSNKIAQLEQTTAIDQYRPSPQRLASADDVDQEIENLRQRKKEIQYQENLIKEKQRQHQRQVKMELNRIRELKDRLNGKFAYDYNGDIIIMKNKTKTLQMPPQVLRAIIDNQNQTKKKSDTTQVTSSEDDALNLLKQKPFQELAQKVAKQQTDKHPNPQIDEYLKQYLGSQKFQIPDVPFRVINEIKETPNLISKQAQYSSQQQAQNSINEPQQVLVLPHLQLKPGVKLTQKVGKDCKIQEEPVPRELQTLKKSEWDNLIQSSQGTVLREVEKYHCISAPQNINDSTLGILSELPSFQENPFKKKNIITPASGLLDLNKPDISQFRDGRVIKDSSQIDQKQQKKQSLVNFTYKKRKSGSMDKGNRKLPLSRGQSGENSFLSDTGYKSAFVTKKQWRVRLNKDQSFYNSRGNNSFDFYN